MLAALSVRGDGDEDEDGDEVPTARSRSRSPVTGVGAAADEGGGLQSAWRRSSETIKTLLELASMFVGGDGDDAQTPPRNQHFALPERGSTSLAAPERQATSPSRESWARPRRVPAGTIEEQYVAHDSRRVLAEEDSDSELRA